MATLIRTLVNSYIFDDTYTLVSFDFNLYAILMTDYALVLQIYVIIVN